MKTLEGRVEKLERLIKGDPKDLSRKERFELIKREQEALLDKYRRAYVSSKEN